MATGTYYPDDVVDGWVAQGAGTETWADIQGGSGSAADDSNDSLRAFLFDASTTTDRWDGLYRGILVYDASEDVSAQAIAISATLTVYGAEKNDNLSISPDVNVYESSPASNTALVSGDFNSLGTTPLSDPIAYADFNVSGATPAANVYIINDAGLAVIQTALRSDGIIKLGLRNANYDVANVAPAWSSGAQSNIEIHSAEKGTTFRSKLEVVFASGQYPSDPASRATELVHRYTSANVPTNKILTLEVLLGGATLQSMTVLSQKPPTDPELVPVPPSAIPVPPPPDAPLQDPFATPVMDAPAFIGYDPLTGKEQWLMPDGTVVLRDPDEQPPRAGRGPSRAI